jgi:hypothetical protein
MTAPAETEAGDPDGIFTAFDDLLKKPRLRLGRADGSGPMTSCWRVLGGAGLCWLLYGAAAGFFQGGGQILVTALKTALTVAASLALCVPSLYVFASLLGADLSPRRFLAVVSGFGGLVGLLLLGLLPVGWLFSVSSSSLAFMAWLHVFLWLLAVSLAGQFLADALRQLGSRSVATLWVVLFCVVSFQVATVLRPVLWRAPGAPLFEGRKMFFLDHFGGIVGGKGGGAARPKPD